MRQGEKGSSIFILHDGVLEVIARNGYEERQLVLLQPPAVVGELAFLIGEPAALRSFGENRSGGLFDPPSREKRLRLPGHHHLAGSGGCAPSFSSHPAS